MKDERIQPRGWPANSDERRSRKALIWHKEWTKRLKIRENFPEDLDPGLASALDFAPKAAELQWLDPDTEEPLPEPKTFQRYRGAFFGAVIGDAYGSAVNAGAVHRFSWRPIIDLGEDLLTEFVPHGALLPTAVTQLSAFTLEGLIRARVAFRVNSGDDDPLPELQHAYQRWLYTQVVGWGQQGRWQSCGGPYATRTPEPDGWLIRNRGLFVQHVPNPGVLDTLTNYARTGTPSTLQNPVGRARGGDVLVRAAMGSVWPVKAEEAFSVGAGIAALTHGHPDDYLAAGFLAHTLRLQLQSAPFTVAVYYARRELANHAGHERTLSLVDKAAGLIKNEYTPMKAAQLRNVLGDGSDGASALAIGLYVALASDYFRESILLAMNYSAHRSAVGAISGLLLGAELGVQAIPRSMRAPLELGDLLDALFDDVGAEFFARVTADDDWQRRYPGW